MYSIVIIMFGWNLCSKFNFSAIFPILANFATFLDHTNENTEENFNFIPEMTDERMRRYWKKSVCNNNMLKINPDTSQRSK